MVSRLGSEARILAIIVASRPSEGPWMPSRARFRVAFSAPVTVEVTDVIRPFLAVGNCLTGLTTPAGDLVTPGA